MNGALDPIGSSQILLPHHRLVAYSVALELLAAVRAAQVRDAKLRDEALRSAKSACLNTAEGAGRVSRPDKARSFTIARAEACEAAAAVEIAESAGEASPGSTARVNLVPRPRRDACCERRCSRCGRRPRRCAARRGAATPPLLPPRAPASLRPRRSRDVIMPGARHWSPTASWRCSPGSSGEQRPGPRRPPRGRGPGGGHRISPRRSARTRAASAMASLAALSSSAPMAAARSSAPATSWTEPSA